MSKSRKRIEVLSAGLCLEDEQLIHINGGFENANGISGRIDDVFLAINHGVCENTACTNSSPHCSDDINHAPCTNTGC